jgi:hypothetical protein
VLSVLSSFADQSSSLYPVKRAGEQALLAITIDPVDRSQLEVKLAQAREREAEDMAGRGDGDATVTALNARYDLLHAAQRDLLSVPVHGTRWQAARRQLFGESDQPMSTIEHDLQTTGQERSSADVVQLVAGFDAQRRPIETELGRPAAPPGQTGG